MARLNKKRIAKEVEAEKNEEEIISNDCDSLLSTNGNPNESEDEPLSVNISSNKKLKKTVAENSKIAKKSNKTPSKKSKKDEPINKQNKPDNKDEFNEVEEEEEEEEFEVQDIIDHKVEDFKTFYLVRWKGYTKDDDTWEPKESLSCKELIEKYEKKRAQATNGKPKKNEKKSPKEKNVNSKTDDSKEWEVEKIIDYGEEKGGLVYRIRWKGYSAKYDTWEPRENLFCDDLIEKFDRKMKDLGNLSFKELRQEPKKTKRLVNETAVRTHLHNPIGRSSKRTVAKKRVFYDSMCESDD